MSILKTDQEYLAATDPKIREAIVGKHLDEFLNSLLKKYRRSDWKRGTVDFRGILDELLIFQFQPSLGYFFGPWFEVKRGFDAIWRIQVRIEFFSKYIGCPEDCVLRLFTQNGFRVQFASKTDNFQNSGKQSIYDIGHPKKAPLPPEREVESLLSTPSRVTNYAPLDSNKDIIEGITCPEEFTASFGGFTRRLDQERSAHLGPRVEPPKKPLGDPKIGIKKRNSRVKKPKENSWSYDYEEEFQPPSV
jgi:hypothetical protein